MTRTDRIEGPIKGLARKWTLNAILTGVIIALFIPFSILVLYFIAQLVGLINKPPVQPTLFVGTNNAVRIWLELCSFAANVIVAGVAWFALRFAADQARQARKQAAEAEHSRTADVYLHITGRFTSPEISHSRALLTNLIRNYRSNSRGFATLGEYIHDNLEPLRTSGQLSDLQAYRCHVDILAFFEDVGVLVKQKYVRERDLRLMFRSALMTIRGSFEHHIVARRDAEKAPTLFENFMELCLLMEAPDDRTGKGAAG